MPLIILILIKFGILKAKKFKHSNVGINIIETELYTHLTMFNTVSQIHVQVTATWHDCKYHYVVNFKMPDRTGKQKVI
ncbi:hypothetical protein EFS00_09260 [Lactobacillus amylovorus]|nr:hypothetical protein [Lactobacillus amylovorus]